MRHFVLSRRSPRFFRALFLSVAAVLFLALPALISAQGTTSTLGGEVTDSTGGRIPGATVTVTSDETGVDTVVKTNSAGSWRVDSLIAGHYHFVVQAPGFQTLEHSSIELQIADSKLVDVALVVGKVNDAVVVTSETPLIDLSATVSGTTLGSEDFQELPSESGSVMDFVRLSPGVFLAAPSGGAALLWSTNSLSSITTNGAGSGNNAMNYLIDGATDTIVSNGQLAFIPPSDAVREVKTLTNAYDAAIERTAAGTVNMTIKSGGKSFHGSLYERNINNWLNAPMWGKNTPNINHMNEWGGSIGGPVWIPKLYDGRKRGTFFFFNYDGIHNVSPAATGNISLPTLAERNGDFSQTQVSFTTGNVPMIKPIELYDPATATSAGQRTAFQGAMIPQGRISPAAKAIAALLPLPNRTPDIPGTDLNNYALNEPKIDKFSSYIGRLDQNWNNSHNSYIEYRYNHLDELANDAFGPNNPLTGSYLLRTNYGLTASHSWTLSPSLLLTMIGNATIYKTSTYSPGNAPGVSASSFGFSSNFVKEQFANGLPALTNLFSSLGGGTTGTIGNLGLSYENDYNYEGRVTLQQVHKTHSLHYGFGYLAQQEATGSQNGMPGVYNFTNVWTTPNPNQSAAPQQGSSFASFLLGLPACGTGGCAQTPAGSVSSNATAYYSQPYLGAYIQDEWRVKPRLTLSFGLRWDLQEALTERHDKYWTRFDPNYNLTPITNYAQAKYATSIAGSSTNAGTQLLQQQRSDVSSFVARGAILYAGQNGTSRSMTDLQYKYFQPRVGFAYLVQPNLVIRGGFGRFVQSNYVANHANQTGYSATTSFTASTDNYVTIAGTLDNPYPNGFTPITGNTLGVLTSPGSVTSYYTSDIKRQYTDDYSLHAQLQIKDYFFELGGVYEFTNGLVVGFHGNNPTPAQFHAAYDPVFDATGAPVTQLPGDVQVTNPFKGAPYLNATQTQNTSTTVSAYSLLRPNPLLGDVTENFYNGKSDHYALQARAQRRMRNGFAFTTSFSWGKQMDSTGFVTNSVFSQNILRQLSSSDRRFQFTAAPTYTLPFGRGKLIGRNVNHFVDALIGGWEASTVYTFWSGLPLSLPTNSGYFAGGDPAVGNKTRKHWFDTSKFISFPTVGTPAATVRSQASYPAWTGIQSLPGYNWTPTSNTGAQNGVYNDYRTWSTNFPTQYGDVRNPYTNNWDIGVRKNFNLDHGMRLQLKLDAFNALNHPRFGNISTSNTSAFFGYVNGSNTLAQQNDPRIVQLSGRFSF